MEHRVGGTLFFSAGHRILHIHQLRHLVIYLLHLVADDHLELSAAVHHRDHALQTAHLLFIRQFSVPQHQPQSGETMGYARNVFFSAHLIHDLSGQLSAIHNILLNFIFRAHRRKNRPGCSLWAAGAPFREITVSCQIKRPQPTDPPRESHQFRSCLLYQ